MSPEERLNRLERAAKLLVTSGRRTRSDLRTNINALIDAQMRHEIRFNEQFTRLSTGQAQNDVLRRELIVAQGRTEEQVKELAASHKDLASSHKELAASHQELVASHQELVASHQELTTAHKELGTATQDLAVSQKELAVSQKQTEEKLRTLIDIVERDRNGKS